MPRLTAISAVTLHAPDMAASVAFYRRAAFEVVAGGADSRFTTLRAGEQCLNLNRDEGAFSGCWGRVIFYVDDVDAMYEHLRRQGLSPDFAPRDAPWGERYFHISDPAGHELSFARPLA